MKKFFEIIFQIENLTILFEIIGFITGLILLKRIKEKFLKNLILFLSITISVEIIGLLTTYFHQRNLNTIVYNNYLAIEFCFYLYLVLKIIRKKTVKRMIFGVICFYAAIGLVNNMLVQGKHGSFTSITYSLGCFFVISSLLYYFYELMLFPSSISLIKQPAFWICSGLLFFYTSTFSIFGLTNFISKLPTSVYNGISIFITITNIVLYSMFSIAFVCQTQIPKSYSSSSLAAS